MKQISFALLSVLTIFLGYYADRTDFIPFILAFLAAFLLYGWLAFGYHNISFRHLLWLGVALRLLLLFSMPQMSDDVFRFLWDGRLTVAGYHPFLHTPRYFIDSHTEIPGITPDLFLRLNSPDYFTVYPPVCQAVFAAAGFVSPVEVLTAVVVIKLFMLIFEGYTVWLLWKNRGKFGLPENAAVMYALNPLVILEFSCHDLLSARRIYRITEGQNSARCNMLGTGHCHQTAAPDAAARCMEMARFAERRPFCSFFRIDYGSTLQSAAGGVAQFTGES
jgi:hypothetical protein